MKVIYCLVIMFCPYLGIGQTTKPLTVGDVLPELTFQKVINCKDTTAKLSDFKGRYIILDFWAVWCGACITKLPALDSLQEKYKDHLSFILVDCMRRSHDTEETITRLFTVNWQETYRRNFNCVVVADSSDLFKTLFSFKMIPHYVWLDTKGKIIAITSSAEVTDANIGLMLKGTKLSLPVKQDFNSNNSN